MSSTLPSDVGYGRVKGNLAKVVVDAEDLDDLPDTAQLTGSVTFTPTVPYVIHEGSKKFFVLTPITVPVTAGLFDVKLLGSDNVQFNPTDWAYTVHFALEGVTVRDFTVQVPVDSVNDLVDWLPVAVIDGVLTMRGPAGPAGAGGGGTGNLPGLEAINVPNADPMVPFDGGVSWSGEFFGEHLQLVRASLRNDGSLTFQVNGLVFYGEAGWFDIAAFGGAGTEVLEGIGAGLGPVATRAWVTATGGGTVPDDLEVESLVLKVPGHGFDGFTHRLTVGSGEAGLLIERWDEESSGWVDWLDVRREAGTEAVNFFSALKTTGSMRNSGPVFKVNQDGDDVLQPFFYASDSQPSWTAGPNGEVVVWIDLSGI